MAIPGKLKLNNDTQQIFQTSKPTRWKSVKWTTRVLAIVAIFFFVVLGIALYSGSLPSLPNMQAKAKQYETRLDPSNPLTLKNAQNEKYKGFKAFLIKKLRTDSINKLRSNTASKANSLSVIRAAFYTPWTGTTSLPDLKINADKLNTIFPEWFFIDTITYKLNTRIDSAGLALMKQKQLHIIPIFSNFSTKAKGFDGKLLHKILSDSFLQKNIIQQVADTLSYYQLNGINIDFEELIEPTNALLTEFQRKIYEKLHEKNMLVTMDVEPKNNDYDYKKLSDYNDYIILMAYDEYNNSTGPGPISAQKWIEDAVSWTAQRIEHSKIILGLGGFGYDWINGKFNSSLTYNDVINKAKALNEKIIYDNDSYNLHYNYASEEEGDSGEINKTEHEVWFTDAATTFNILRFADEFPVAGTALWRLGSEDQRIWKYYNRNLSNASLEKNPFDFDSLKTVPVLYNNVGFEGEGEVLNIVSAPQQGKINLEIDSSEQLIAEQNYEQLPSGYIIQKFAEDTVVGKGHKLILTFDDGPSAEWTPQILNILEREKVPATFFVVGINAEQNIPLLQREYRDGFEIGNHTFTHHNIADMSLQRAAIEMKLTRLLIESITGHSTILFRAPYNADSEPQTYEELAPIERSRSENYLTVNESIDPNDWAPHVTADSIVARVIKQEQDGNASIILLHDAGGDTREATVEALPRIIDYFKSKGYVFTTVANLMGKTKEEVMPRVASERDRWTRKFNFFLAEAGYWSGQILFSLFLIGIILSVGRIVLMAVLASIQRNREKRSVGALPAFTRLDKSQWPLVSIIVPAYNEELNAIRTVKSLLAQDYPQLEIIFVDDGSKDDTFSKVKKYFLNNAKVQVYTKSNGGKASALNYGIQKSSAEFVVCIDADTQLKTNAVTELMKKFDTDNVAAVAGNVKVGNQVNMITNWQNIEYITSQNFDRRAFDLLNCIIVVPGAIGAFRKDAVLIAGGFTTDTLAEDCDLTMRLLINGYSIRNCTSAVSYTEAPETFRQFLKQRFRWSFGVMQCFWKHRGTVFNPKYKNFGMIAMPNILIYQMILPVLAPLADIILVLSIIAASFGVIVASVPHIILYYIIFTFIDVAGAALAFAFEKENHFKLIWMLPQRLIYRQLMYYILIKSFNKAIKGELQGWGALKRTGSVKEVSVVK